MPKSVLGIYIYTYVQTAELRSDLSESSVQTVEHERAERLYLAQTGGMTIEELADCLEEIIAGQEIGRPAFATATFDTIPWTRLVELVPPKRRALLLLNAWRFAMIGIPVVFQLSILHRIVIAYGSDLPEKRHRAEADTLMTIKIQDAFFKGTLNALAPTGVLRYFKAFKTYDVERDEVEAVRNIRHFCFILNSSIIEVWKMVWQGKSHDLKLDALMDPCGNCTRFSGVCGQRVLFLSFSSRELLGLISRHPLLEGDKHF